jgi:hypothetical protein
MVEREDGEVAPFDEAKEAVDVAFVRHRTEVAVREFLEVARRRTDVRVEAEP